MVMQCSDELPPYRSFSCSFSTGKTIFAEPLKEEEENMDANHRSPRMCQTYATTYHIIWLIKFVHKQAIIYFMKSPLKTKRKHNTTLQIYSYTINLHISIYVYLQVYPSIYALMSKFKFHHQWSIIFVEEVCQVVLLKYGRPANFLITKSDVYT